MIHPKFIITNQGCLRLGAVTLHRDLLMAHEQCWGGGFYEFDYVTNQLLLSGKSFDFGPPQWSKISVLQMPESLRGISVIYRDRWGDEFNLNTRFTIKYY